VLVDPPCSELNSLVAANQATSSTRGTYDVGGKSLAQLSTEAREQLFHAALDYTKSYREVASNRGEFRSASSAFLLAGHQPELFHPGVWAKNFVLSSLAKAAGATAINLVIDGDVLKSPTIRVPGGSIDSPRVEAVAFDRATEPMPYEDRRILDRECFASFGRRATDVVRPLVPHPLLETFWPLVLEESKRSDVLGDCFSRTRHRLEEAWGLETLELPQSQLCETASFHWFTCHLLANLPRFHEAHNGALAEYRRVEHVRGEGRPVPPLAQEDEWLEALLWIWTADEPQRRRVFIRRVGTEMEITDRAAIRLRLPLSVDGSPESAVAALGELRARGIRLRSRALLTTLYARVVVDSTFLHGIGGGKYDELTDEIVRRFFGFEPPGFAVVTATRHLPIVRPAPVGEDATALRHRQWELAHHPEKFIAPAAQESQARDGALRLVAEKRRLVTEAAERSTTKDWCQAIRRVNRELQPYVAAARRTLAETTEAQRHFFHAETVLTNREYASFLFPEKDLRDFLLAISPVSG
jgi:hypothetical protein